MTAANNYIWEYFERNGKNATCRHCGQVYVGYNHNRLKQHLLNICKHVPPEIRDNFLRETAAAITSLIFGAKEESREPPPTLVEVPYITNQLSNHNSSHGQNQQPSTSRISNQIDVKQKADETLAKAMLSSGVPLEFVENPKFKKFLKLLNPTYHPPEAKQLLTPNVIKDLKKTAKSLIDSAHHVTITSNAPGQFSITVHSESPTKELIMKHEPKEMDILEEMESFHQNHVQ
uniref:BED-type domain-containing protein n=2 Tax=Bursaphelenchus xylophilus TaxID=6326 RepID=A0A1I7SWZ7_BURXY